MAVACGSGGVDRVVEGRRARGEDFQALPEIGVRGGFGERVVGRELCDADAVDEEAEHVDRVDPWGELAGAPAGADGPAVSCELTGEPLRGGPVDRQDGGVGDNGRHGTPWARTEFLADPVSTRGFPCASTGFAHAQCAPACSEYLTHHFSTARLSSMSSKCIHFRQRKTCPLLGGSSRLDARSDARAAIGSIWKSPAEFRCSTTELNRSLAQSVNTASAARRVTGRDSG